MWQHHGSAVAPHSSIWVQSGANFIPEFGMKKRMESERATIISVRANPELVRLRNFVLGEAGFNVTFTLDEHDASVESKARKVWCLPHVRFTREVGQAEPC